MILINEGEAALLNLQLADGDIYQYPIAKIVSANKDFKTKSVRLKHEGQGLYINESEVLLPGQYTVSYLVYEDKKFEKLSARYPIVTDDISVQKESKIEKNFSALKKNILDEFSSLKEDVALKVGAGNNTAAKKVDAIVKEFNALAKKMDKLKEESSKENKKLTKDFTTVRDLTKGAFLEPNKLMKDYLSNQVGKLVSEVMEGVDKRVAVVGQFQEKSDGLRKEVSVLTDKMNTLKREKEEFVKLTTESKDTFVRTAAKAKEMRLKLDAMTQEYSDCEVFVRKIPSKLAVKLNKVGDNMSMYFDGSEVLEFFPNIQQELSTMNDCVLEGYLTQNPYTILALLKRYKSASTELSVTKKNVDKIPFEYIGTKKVESPDELSMMLAEDGLFEIQANSKKYLFSKNEEEGMYTYNELLSKIEPSIFLKPTNISETELNDYFQDEEFTIAVEENLNTNKLLFIKDGSNVCVRENFKDVTENFTEQIAKIKSLAVDCAIFCANEVPGGRLLLSDVLYFNGFNLCSEPYENRRKLLEKVGEENNLFEEESTIKVSEFAIVDNFTDLKKTINSFAKEGKHDLLFKPMAQEFNLVDKSYNAIISFAMKKGTWIQ